MEFVNNSTSNNHLSTLNNLFKDAKEIVIISPFLSKRIDFFSFSKLTNLDRITLITTLKPNDIDQYNKMPVFNRLYELSKQNNFELDIFIDNSLHAKIYISKNEDGKRAIITSANFTNNGLTINNEWGVLIDELVAVDEIETEFLTGSIFKSLSKNDIDRLTSILEMNPLNQVEKEQVTVNLLEEIELKDNPLNISRKANFWLKPIGHSENYVSLDTTFNNKELKLHFAKNPVSVKEGDIIIAYAVGYKNILSICRVKSGVNNTGLKGDRWPYYVIGDNLTPYYGQFWRDNDVHISDEKREVLENELFDITPSGKNSFGSLMRGADKLRVTKEFGEYIIRKVLYINEELKTEANNS